MPLINEEEEDGTLVVTTSTDLQTKGPVASSTTDVGDRTTPLESAVADGTDGTTSTDLKMKGPVASTTTVGGDRTVPVAVAKDVGRTQVASSVNDIVIPAQVEMVKRRLNKLDSLYPLVQLKDMSPDWFNFIFQRDDGRGDDYDFTAVSHRLASIQRALTSLTSPSCLCPSPDNIWRWTDLPPQRVKVVLLGREPYNAVETDSISGNVVPVADGLAYSVNPRYVDIAKSVPPTVHNILKLVQGGDSTGAATAITTTAPKCYGDLTTWMDQGVLLLNTVLTTIRGQANAHATIGWQYFTDRVVAKLGSGSEPPRVFMLWGAEAATKVKLIDSRRHVVLTACHPSPLTAYRNGWFNHDHFKTANDHLARLYGSVTGPINWKAALDVQATTTTTQPLSTRHIKQRRPKRKSDQLRTTTQAVHCLESKTTPSVTTANCDRRSPNIRQCRVRLSPLRGADRNLVRESKKPATHASPCNTTSSRFNGINPKLLPLKKRPYARLAWSHVVINDGRQGDRRPGTKDHLNRVVRKGRRKRQCDIIADSQVPVYSPFQCDPLRLLECDETFDQTSQYCNSC